MLPRSVGEGFDLVVQIGKGAEDRHGFVSIEGDPFEDGYDGGGSGGDGTIETVLNAMVETAGVKVLPRFKKGSIFGKVIRGVISGGRGVFGRSLSTAMHPVGSKVSSPSKQIGADIANVSRHDEDDVAEIGRDGRKNGDVLMGATLRPHHLPAGFLVVINMSQLVPAAQLLHAFTNVGVGIVAVANDRRYRRRQFGQQGCRPFL